MIGWVDSLCSDWGAHKRWVYADIVHPLPSVMGRIMDEGKYAAAHRRTAQNFKEVFSPNSLVVSRALVGMKPELVAVMVVHYIYDVPLSKKPGLVTVLHGKPISLRTYWRRIHRAHCHLATNMETPPEVCAA
jgi:hypothetical protein